MAVYQAVKTIKQISQLLTTVDATVTTLLEIVIPNDSQMQLSLSYEALKSDQSKYYSGEIGARSVCDSSGVVTMPETVVYKFRKRSASDMNNPTINVSTANKIIIQVTGINANNIKHKCMVLKSKVRIL